MLKKFTSDKAMAFRFHFPAWQVTCDSKPGIEGIFSFFSLHIIYSMSLVCKFIQSLVQVRATAYVAADLQCYSLNTIAKLAGLQHLNRSTYMVCCTCA